MLDDIWDSIVDGFLYLISFQWLGDAWEFITGMFENIGEFSFAGLTFGIISAGMIFLLRKQMLDPFLVYMDPFSKIFWMVATYLATAGVGYFVGKKLFDD